MVTSRKHDTKWIFPKGGLEHGETLIEAVVRESYEEAGTPQVLPSANEAIEIFRAYSRSGDGERIIDYHIFEIEVHPEDLCTTWPEDGQRKREWVPVGEAAVRCTAWRNEKNTKFQLFEGFKRCKVYQDHLAELEQQSEKASTPIVHLEESHAARNNSVNITNDATTTAINANTRTNVNGVAQ